LEVDIETISSNSEEVADENRLIRIGMEYPAGEVYQLETPTECLAGECSGVKLVEPSGLRIPPHNSRSLLLLELTCDVPLVLP
jgi:hypothetical protein